jgi:hypothetical protein
VNEYTYHLFETFGGTHILIFKNGIFERKITVSAVDYRSKTEK